MKYNDNGEYKDIYVKAFDTLPVGTEVDYDGSTVPSGWTEVDDPNVYSTDEVRIGTWIDGKPLYRKVISLTLPNSTYNSDQVIADLTDLAIDKIIKLEGIIYASTTQVITNFAYQGNVQYCSLYYTNSAKTLRYSTNNIQYANVPANIILEYTKTTD